ncbi:MAG: hypothetical protein Q7K21_02715 [Elusimicrobiota bacterium]|nr:hypothetical protein [Elusimicrobiota bacterium]
MIDKEENFCIIKPLKKVFVVAKRRFTSVGNKAEITLCGYKKQGFSVVS